MNIQRRFQPPDCGHQATAAVVDAYSTAATSSTMDERERGRRSMTKDARWCVVVVVVVDRRRCKSKRIERDARAPSSSSSSSSLSAAAAADDDGNRTVDKSCHEYPVTTRQRRPPIHSRERRPTAAFTNLKRRYAPRVGPGRIEIPCGQLHRSSRIQLPTASPRAPGRS